MFDTPRWTLGYFIERDPSLKRPVYSVLDGPYADFLAHLNSHGNIDFYGDPSDKIVNPCRFCKILREERDGISSRS